ncbi:hypothetical protein EK904_007997 [Melospiza melodia maxima]|nr:hypothetical protein EK904_007997 [Melospiza melodia maxima]
MTSMVSLVNVKHRLKRILKQGALGDPWLMKTLCAQ